MAEYVGLDFLRVHHFERGCGRPDDAGVACLAAGFGIERGGVEHYNRILPRFDFLHGATVHV